jgi:hypothetical protein
MGWRPFRGGPLLQRALLSERFFLRCAHLVHSAGVVIEPHHCEHACTDPTNMRGLVRSDPQHNFADQL